MSAPNITVGQVALDPYNKVLYYRKLTGEMVSTSLDWLLNGNNYGRMVTGDEVTISNDLIVNGNLTVNGTTTTINAEEVTIEDSILILNSNATGTPTADAGIEIERGDQTNVQLLWNELENKWQFTNDGVTYYDINSIIEDSVTLGYHTVGDYIKNLVAGTGVSITNNSGEGATPTISIGQPVSTTSTVTFALVNANLAGNVTGNLTGNVTGNVSGQVSDLSNHGINSLNDVDATPSNGQFLKWNGSSWVNDAIDLTTDTVGDYVKNLVAGTGVSIVNNSGEGATPNISIGQPVGTTDTVTFNVVNADLTGDVTGQVSDISNHGISDLSDVTIADPANGDFLRYNGANWINDPVNLTTDTVGDYVAKLAAGTGITITNNSGEGATPNIAFSGSINDVTDVVITSAQNGQILEYDGTAWVNTVRPSSEPIGHENKADSVISFNESTREFSISPASTSYTVWCTGKRYVKTSTETVTIPDTSGLYYIYFNSSGSLAYKTTFFTWDQDTPTAYVYWNQDDDKAHFFADERHGVTLDWATHEYLHRTRGAAIANGFGANNYTLTGDGSSDAHAKIDIADGTFFDEDLQVDITHSASPTADTWQQRLQSGAYIPVFYRLNGAWKKDTATEFPVKKVGTRSTYNLNTSGTWSTQEIDNSKYGVMFIVATNNLNEPVLAIMGQAQYTDQGSAEASTWDELDLAGFPIVEFRPLYKIVFQTATAYTNTPKTKFVNLLDLRQVISGGTGGSSTAVSDHGNLTGLSDDDHTQYLLADGTRTAASLTVSGAVTASSLIVDGIEIDTTGPSDTNVLKYSSALNKYVPGVASTVASLDDLTDVIISSATPNQVLKYDGTNWINAVSPSSVEGTTYFATIGNGSTTTFTITHGLSTRDLVVSFTETASPYASFSTLWEATTLNAITVYFETAPTANAVRVSIYAAVSGVPVSTDLDSLSDVSLGTLANGDFLRYNGSYWINDPVNLSTDTVGDYVASLVAGTGITITNNSGEGSTPTIAVTSNTYQPLDGDLTAIAALSGTSGLLKKTSANTWTLDTSTYLTSLALTQLTDVNAGAPSNDQVLTYDSPSSRWVAKTFSATVSALDSIGDVTTPSPSTGEFLKWNGTAWVNSNEVRDNNIRYLMDVS